MPYSDHSKRKAMQRICSARYLRSPAGRAMNRIKAKRYRARLRKRMAANPKLAETIRATRRAIAARNTVSKSAWAKSYRATGRGRRAACDAVRRYRKTPHGAAYEKRAAAERVSLMANSYIASLLGISVARAPTEWIEIKRLVVKIDRLLKSNPQHPRSNT